MSEWIKAAELARNIGVSRSTVRDWCQRDPELAVKRGHDYWIRLERLAERPGLDPVKVHTLTKSRWIKAIDLALLAGAPRRTIARWCKDRPEFAMRIGRTWYVCLDQLGATEEQARTLEKWVPTKRAAISLVRKAGELSHPDMRKGEAL